MKRDYETGVKDNVEFFVGTEVEKTPAYGMKTLFVTGIHSYITIKQHIANEQVEHVFFGANHSYNPELAEDFEEWEAMILPLVKEGILCSLDIPSTINMDQRARRGLSRFLSCQRQCEPPRGPGLTKWCCLCALCESNGRAIR